MCYLCPQRRITSIIILYRLHDDERHVERHTEGSQIILEHIASYRRRTVDGSSELILEPWHLGCSCSGTLKDDMPGLAHFFQHMPFLVSVFLVYIIMELNTSVMDGIVSHIKRIRVRHGVSPFKLHVLVLSWIGFPPSSTPLFYAVPSATIHEL